MCILETLFMLIAVGVAFHYKGDDFYPLLISSGILFSVGTILYTLGFRANEYTAGRREGMLTVTFTWILLSLMGMLPFYIGGYIDNITDAFFETMSGFTTTGASVFTDVEVLPKGILLWRSLTQWQGGIGMIVFTVALIPIIGGGASQMFNAEIPSITHERFRPRVTQAAKRLWGVYLFLTLLLVGLLWLGPMDLYDSVNHALTTISTGGYSTKNASIAYWDSAYIEYITILFMFIGATNITLIYFFFNGQVKKLFKDEEFRWFFWAIVTFTGITTIWLLYQGITSDFLTAIRQAAFQVVALVSTTGLATENYIEWGPFFWMIALIMMFICGCAGSTSGGLKTGRVVILVKNLFNEFKKQTHPHAIIPVRMDSRVVSADIVHRILAFVFAYTALIVFSSIVLMVDGLGFEESIGAAISAISNIGPALGELGPMDNYANVPIFSKWYLSFLMLTGRLEVFTVLTLLVPGFWKQ